MPKPDRFLNFTAAALRVAIYLGAAVMVACLIVLAVLWPHLWRGMP